MSQLSVGGGTAARAPVSRRQLLKAGLLAAPCLLGARSLVGWAVAAADASPAGANAEPIVPRYDATRHAWGFVVDTRACIGCGLCVEACRDENHVPDEAGCNRTWVERHSIGADGSVRIESPEGGAHGFPVEPALPQGDGLVGAPVQSYFVPRLCMQCDNPPCVSVCPVSATYKTADGVVLVDQGRCIGCGYCVVACPYGARYIVPSGGDTPTGAAGVADKCTFCYHRVTDGRQPACVSVCPTSARRFGDLNDPTSAPSRAIREERVQVMDAAFGTEPRVRYIGLQAGDA